MWPAAVAAAAAGSSLPLSIVLLVLSRQTKPLTFADCIGDELPVGWEEAYDPAVGAYYVDHNTSEYISRLVHSGTFVAGIPSQ